MSIVIRRARGLSLVELMVALTIGSLLIGGALYMYQQGRSSYALNERITLLQDAGRYVISVIEPDLELAGYYGFTNSAQTVRFVKQGDPGKIVVTARQMRQFKVVDSDPTVTAVPDLPEGAHVCGTNFAVDVLVPVQGSNGTFQLGPGEAGSGTKTGCETTYGASAKADTLTIRRAAAQPSDPDAGRIQIYAQRMGSRTAHFLFADGTVPGVVNDDNQVRDLVVRSYYVAPNSVGRAGLPALRVKTLTQQAGRIVFNDDEVMQGVEDLQVQFGIDTGDYDANGVIDAGVDVNADDIPESDGRVTRYVNPDFPNLHRYQVVAVRLWVRVRAEQIEPGFQDTRPYSYADVSFSAQGDERKFRRVVLSRTITLRNARTL